MIILNYIKLFELRHFNFNEKKYVVKLIWNNQEAASKIFFFNINYKTLNMNDRYFQLGKISYDMLDFVLEEEKNERLNILSDRLENS